MTAIAAIGGLVFAVSSRVPATSRRPEAGRAEVLEAGLLEAGAVADAAGLDPLLCLACRVCDRESAASVGVADWTSTTGAKVGSGEPALAGGGAADLVGDGPALGGTDGVRDGLGLGLDGLGDGVGVGVAVGVADDVGVGVVVGAPEGVAEAVAVGVSVGAADGDGAAEDGSAEDGSAEGAGVDEPETGATSAGRMTATVEILAAGPDWTLAGTSPVRARSTVAAAVAAPGVQARAAAAQAVIAPRTVSAVRPALRSWPLWRPCGPGGRSL
ncbi:MAG TPA: hypothetical protein VNW50_09235 [Streptosporangiaceae bacterium]|nr:hypothetical protein [Streptosporangiaceae bacterium]